MSISSTTPISGADLAVELQEFVHEISSELAQSARDTNRSARETELQDSLLAAEETREEASKLELGACISGALTIASGLGQVYGATKIQCSADAGANPQADAATKVAELDAHNRKVQSMNSAATTLSSVGAAVNQGLTAFGKRDEARAQEYQATAKAAGHQADEAETDRQTATKMDESVRQLWQEVNRTHHAAVLTIFANR